MSVLRIFLSLLVLSFLVFIHELGHYLVGKKSGIGVIEFAVGFGPKLWSKEVNGTVYSLRAIPLGGFTQFEGEDEESKSPTAMNNVSVGKRFLTVLAGPVFNIAFAFILSIGVLFVYGETNSTIVKVADDTPAISAGLQAGDKIVSVNGRDTVFSMEVSAQLYRARNEGDRVEMTVLRDGREQTVSAGFNSDGLVGFSMGQNEKYSLWSSVKMSARWGYAVVYDTFMSLAGLFKGTQPIQDMGGAVAIVGIMGSAMQAGLYPLLQIAVMTSLSLGIMNLLPIPALDGGRLVLLTVEGIRRKPLNRDLEARINLGGFMVMMGLMVLMIFNDFRNIFLR